MNRRPILACAAAISLGIGIALAGIAASMPAQAQYPYACPPGNRFDPNYGSFLRPISTGHLIIRTRTSDLISSMAAVGGGGYRGGGHPGGVPHGGLGGHTGGAPHGGGGPSHH